jgi:hypothetical protein
MIIAISVSMVEMMDSVPLAPLDENIIGLALVLKHIG